MRDGNIVCSDKLMMVAFEINLHILLNFRNKIKPLMSSYLANKLNRIREDIIFFHSSAYASKFPASGYKYFNLMFSDN